MKTPFKDVDPVRIRHGRLKLKRAAEWLEKEVLGIDPGSIRFVKADGQPADPSDTIGSLRSQRSRKIS
jgi:hypothetical protein